MSTPFERGYEAFLDGYELKHCPYRDERAALWRNGWREAKETLGL